jgi:hypothetical protein
MTEIDLDYILNKYNMLIELVRIYYNDDHQLFHLMMYDKTYSHRVYINTSD